MGVRVGTERIFQTKGDVDRGSVFGTFPGGGVSYDASEFERVRDDGVSIIDLVPECRVFIFGADVSKDIESVTVDNSLSGNTCRIRLSNPRGKYEISKADLSKNWREDKDILATYEYDQFKRIKPIRPDMMKMFLKKDYLNQYNQVAGWFSAGNPNVPYPFNVTRMAFETKYFSGIDKRVGDLVFDYRDPVMVFMKGRFSPYWYFAFTGVLVSWDDADTFGQDMTLDLHCEDILYFLKRDKYVKQGSLINAGNYETATRNIHQKMKFNIRDKAWGKKGITLDRAVSMVLFGTNSTYRKMQVKNCNPLYGDLGNLKSKISEASLKDIAKVRDMLEQNFSIGKKDWSFTSAENDFMLTWGKKDTNVFVNDGTTFSNAGHLISSGTISPQGGKLNTNPFGEWLSLYTQLNRIDLPIFDGKELALRYNASVRFWEVRPTIGKPAKESKLTGWADGKSTNSIGIAGIHPALTYDFMNYFNVLGHVWSECFTVAGDSIWRETPEQSSKLDNLNVSPNEKIRELVAGSPTEYRPGGNEETKGSNINLFRPRTFVVMPTKFMDKNKGLIATAIGQLQLQKEATTTSYEALKEICSAIEFKFYTSPMGDIFIEPEMYDSHPTDYVLAKDITKIGKVESRSIIIKEKEIRFRSIDASEYSGLKRERKDRAYMFNPKANHPFFIMEKDRIRCTFTFKPENIKTHITVIGSVSGRGGIEESALKPFSEQNIALLSGQSIYDPKKKRGFTPGVYLADGFGYKIRRSDFNVSPVWITERVQQLKEDYFKLLKSDFFKNQMNTTIQVFFQDTVNYFYDLAIDKYDERFLWRTLLCSDVRSDTNGTIYGQIAEDRNNRYGLEGFTRGQYRILNGLCPETLNLLERTQSQKKGTLTTASKTVELKKTDQLKSWFVANSDSSISTSNQKANSTNITNSFVDAGTKQKVATELLDMYEVHILAVGTTLKEKFEEFTTLGIQKANTKLFKTGTMLTLGRLRDLEKSGYYNPRTDMVRRYGYNAGPVIRNNMIDNGAEAQRYAVTSFNRLFGRSHVIHMDIIGRPELMLNRPYYCERKDSIGLLEKFSLSYSIGSDFQTSLDLTYIRKNSLTYNYSLGELDTLSGNIKNSYFGKAAISYYKSISEMNQFSKGIVSGGFGAMGGAVGNAIGGRVGGEIGSSVFQLSGAGFAGGLYCAHDWIGHMEYDKKGVSDNVVRSKGSSTTDPIAKDYPDTLQQVSSVGVDLIAICRTIQIALDNIIKLEISLDDLLEKKEMKQIDITNSEDALKLLEEYNSAEILRHVKQTSRYLKQDKIALKNIDNDIKKKKEEHRLACWKVYGIQGVYAPKATEGKKTDKPLGKRTPSETEIGDAASLYERNKLIGRDKSLYVQLIDIVVSSGITIDRITPLDDRNVDKFSIDIGWELELPLYAYIKDFVQQGEEEK